MAEFIKQPYATPRDQGGSMKDIQTEYIELQDGRVNQKDWESLLGRLDAVGDEINRELNWTRMPTLQKVHSQTAL